MKRGRTDRYTHRQTYRQTYTEEQEKKKGDKFIIKYKSQVCIGSNGIINIFITASLKPKRKQKKEEIKNY